MLQFHLRQDIRDLIRQTFATLISLTITKRHIFLLTCSEESYAWTCFNVEPKIRTLTSVNPSGRFFSDITFDARGETLKSISVRWRKIDFVSWNLTCSRGWAIDQISSSKIRSRVNSWLEYCKHHYYTNLSVSTSRSKSSICLRLSIFFKIFTATSRPPFLALKTWPKLPSPSGSR